MDMWRALLVIGLLAGTAHADDPPSIKPGAIIETVTAALAHADPKAPRGTGHVIAYVEKADVATATRALRTAIAQQPWKIVDDFATGALAVITIEGPSGARATISVGNERGAIGLTDQPVSTRAPGPCVAIPQVDHDVRVDSIGVSQDGQMFTGQNRWKLSTTRTFDVDGDGIVDAFVPVPATRNTCPEELAWRVYAVRGACGHDLGVVGPGWLVPDAMTVAIDASGFRPLVLESRHATYGKDRIPDMVTTTTSFGIKKGRYAQLSTAQTHGRCHHCAVWRCKATTP